MITILLRNWLLLWYCWGFWEEWTHDASRLLGIKTY